MKNVLYHCCTEAKDQFEQSRREIHNQFPQNMEVVWPAMPLFKKWNEAQIQVSGPISSYYAQFREIWEHSTQPLLTP